MKHLGETPPFRGRKGEVVPGSIAEINYLRLSRRIRLQASASSTLASTARAPSGNASSGFTSSSWISGRSSES
jgi:hypothetical protein